MNIPLEELNYAFQDKPLVIGGNAMEYYGLRKAGADIDLVISARDHENLRQQYPNHIKELHGDLGVCEFDFEIWNQISRYDYEELRQEAVEEETFLVISLERLMFLKTLAIKEEKNHRDVLMLASEILKRKYS